MHAAHPNQVLLHDFDKEEELPAATPPPPPPPPDMPDKLLPTTLLHHHLDDFTPLGSLGRGNMGTVFLVLSHCIPFALKITHALPSKKQRSHVERDILSSLNHPFLQTLHAHFEFGNHSLFLLDFCSGGDLNLLRHRQPEKRFSETAARFYAAEVLLALEHLHKLGIVYRDLKPENILVQGTGHIKLTDFDLSLQLGAEKLTARAEPDAKPQLATGAPPDTRLAAVGTLQHHILADADLEKVQQGGPPHPAGIITCKLCRLQCLGFNGKTRRKKKEKKVKNINKLRMHSACFPLLNRSRDCKNNINQERYVCVVGTDEYVAPEVLRGEEQSFSMDWWSFGIFLYEMIHGHTPFKGPTCEGTLRNILEKEPEFPGMKTLGKQLIAHLLVKDPADRLGTRGGASDIKRHPFFSGVNWESLPYICRPPFIPRSLCLSELEERYNSARLIRPIRSGGTPQYNHIESHELRPPSNTCKFWLDEVVESIGAAAKYNEHASSQYSPSSSAGFQSSSADGADRELPRDGDVDARFSSADWSSELELAAAGRAAGAAAAGKQYRSSCLM